MTNEKVKKKSFFKDWKETSEKKNTFKSRELKEEGKLIRGKKQVSVCEV